MKDGHHGSHGQRRQKWSYYRMLVGTTDNRAQAAAWAAKKRMIARPGGKDHGLGGTHSKGDKRANKEKRLHRPAANASGLPINQFERARNLKQQQRDNGFVLRDGPDVQGAIVKRASASACG